MLRMVLWLFCYSVATDKDSMTVAILCKSIGRHIHNCVLWSYTSTQLVSSAYLFCPRHFINKKFVSNICRVSHTKKQGTAAHNSGRGESFEFRRGCEYFIFVIFGRIWNNFDEVLDYSDIYTAQFLSPLEY